MYRQLVAGRPAFADDDTTVLISAALEHRGQRTLVCVGVDPL